MRITPASPPTVAGAGPEAAASGRAVALAAGGTVRVVTASPDGGPSPDVVAEAALQRAQAVAATSRLLAAQNALASSSVVGQPAPELAPLPT